VVGVLRFGCSGVVVCVCVFKIRFSRSHHGFVVAPSQPRGDDCRLSTWWGERQYLFVDANILLPGNSLKEIVGLYFLIQV
jgi:hypothetical protein